MSDAAAGFTVCGLFYGDFPDIAARCLGSFERLLVPGGPVADIRLALNEASAATERIVTGFLERHARRGIPGRLFRSEINRFKYPVMRKMFRQDDRPLAPYVMWFDDDTWWANEADHSWWAGVSHTMARADMLGQQWTMALSANRVAYFRNTQPWFNPSISLRTRGYGGKVSNITKFCQGAWWVLRRLIIEKHDWPAPVLRHNGGDSMLGELMYHQGYRVKEFDRHVHINAGPSGKKSSSRRRGASENVLGNRLEDLARVLDFHNFTLETRDFG